MFLMWLSFGHDVWVPGLQEGNMLQACAAPASYTTTGRGTAITTLVTYTQYMRVMPDSFKIGYNSTTGSWISVLVGIPYTSATKADITTQLAAIGSTNVITPWGKASTGTTDLPVGGPNYGSPGLDFWIDPTPATAPQFADIEDAGGAVASANPFQTDEGSPRSVNRNASSREWAFLNPKVRMPATDGTLTDIGTLISGTDDPFAGLVFDLSGPAGDEFNCVIAMHPLNLHRCKGAIGMAKFSFIENAVDMNALIAKYGTGGFVYQSTGMAKPVGVTANSAVRLNRAMVIRDGAEAPFESLEPYAPEWLEGYVGGKWERRRNSAGERLHSMEATLKFSCTTLPRDALNKRIAVLAYIKPGTTLSQSASA
jgi:hypothetical protein